MPAHGQADAAVLGHAPLGNVEIGHDLDARRDGKGQMPRRRHHLEEHAVGPETNLELALERFEVQVAGMVLDGHEQHHVEQFADRGAVSHDFLGVELIDIAAQLSSGLDRFGQSGVVLQIGNDRFNAFAARRIITAQGLENVFFGGHDRTDIEAQERAQLIDDGKLLRIAHGNRERVVVKLDRHHAIKLGHRFGDVRQHLGRHDNVGQRHHLHAHLLGQPLARAARRC